MSEENTANYLTLSEAADRIHNGSLSPLDLVDACLSRIEEWNPILNAFLTVLADDARREAQHATDALARGEDWGLLHGIPIGVKDLIDVAGVSTTSGSQFMRTNVTEDAVVVQNLKAAGAIIIGKTHLHEYAIGATNVNPHYGPARNPWDTSLSPGGSSGGSAAAVAAGMCPAALGTDTGGSVRMPSALCGLTGLRPTVGAISTQGVTPMSWTLDTVGPMARTAHDVALLYDALAADSASRITGRLEKHLEGLRIGLPEDDYLWQDTNVAIVQAVRTAAQQFAGLGMEQVAVTLPGFKEAERAGGIISLGDAAAYHKERLAESPERFGDDVRARLEWGQSKSAADYAAARHTTRHWRADVLRLFRDEIDLLALPVTPVPSHDIEASEGLRAARELLRFTYPISLTRLPALSLPCGITPDGLPIGIQLVAISAETLLQAAFAFQKITDWHTHRPVLDSEK